jgi:hypothetical protein
MMKPAGLLAMTAVAVAVVAVAVVAVLIKPFEVSSGAFKKWAEAHGKTYSSPEEYVSFCGPHPGLTSRDLAGVSSAPALCGAHLLPPLHPCGFPAADRALIGVLSV